MLKTVLLICYWFLATETKEFNVKNDILSAGYKFESHETQTSDGYLLSLDRILSKNAVEKSKGPILLQHGLFGSFENFLYTGPENSIACRLADVGFDVWMGNFRGHLYSRKHVNLNPDNDSKYWNFTLHEHGVSDLPALIDYILESTNTTSLSYLGHSMGCTAFLILASEDPIYKQKIKEAHLFAPVAYFKHVRSPIYTLLCPLLGSERFNNINPFEVFKPSPTFKKYISKICSTNSLVPICRYSSFILSGPSSFINDTLLSNVYATYPNCGSIKEVVHYCQLKESGTFRRFDFGTNGNFLKYGHSTPPNYILENIHTPIYIYYSKSDYICDPRDTERLRKRLPNIVFEKYYDENDFNHVDFLLSKNINKIVNDLVVKNFLNKI